MTNDNTHEYQSDLVTPYINNNNSIKAMLMTTRRASFTACLRACWPLFGLILAGALVTKGLSPRINLIRCAEASLPVVTMSAVPTALRPIEDIRVGQRVITDLPEGILDLDGQPFDTSLPEGATRVDPATWRLIRMRAEERWPDGTVDDINIETLQPHAWIEANRVLVGCDAPIHLDLVEMGLPNDLRGRVLAIDPCPTIEPEPGNVVLTTVNHLNPAIQNLTIQAGDQNPVTIHSTAWHKFFSVTHRGWRSAFELNRGELLAGQKESVEVVSNHSVGGARRVFNLTVENNHVYRVSNLAVLVHNNGCSYLHVSKSPPHHPATGRPSTTVAGLDPGTGMPIQTVIYDEAGNAIYHIDYRQHGPLGPGHGHTFPPGLPGMGHGPQNRPQHVPMPQVPSDRWPAIIVAPPLPPIGW